MKRLWQLILCLAAAFQLSASADERTGKEFSELIRELNHELTTARDRVREIQAEQQQTAGGPSTAILPERQQELDRLAYLTENLNAATTDAERQRLEFDVQEQVVVVAELSTEFLEAHKSELLSQDRQLAVFEDALARVIVKLDRLNRLAPGSDTVDAEAERLEARRELQSMAQVIEMLANANPDSRQWQDVRQTIMLQHTILRQHSADYSRIRETLGRQRQAYEQAHAQIVLARRGIAEEKAVLSQIALGEVAGSTLRKAAGLLMGNYSLIEVGEGSIRRAQTRHDAVFDYLAQDRDSTTDDDSDYYGPSDYPSGYESFLNEEL